MRQLSILILLLGGLALQSCSQSSSASTEDHDHSHDHHDHSLVQDIDQIKVKKVELSEEEWAELLSNEEYRILRKKGTERSFTGKY
ncbi:MAG: hypothetical protein AAFV80_24080, partial [Bacteroidota bacterium]